MGDGGALRSRWGGGGVSKKKLNMCLTFIRYTQNKEHRGKELRGGEGRERYSLK